MSSFVWMKVLESTPERYDRGVQMLSRGRIGAVYEQIAETVAAPGRRVLDIGCGTGSVSLACAAKGATVTGIDRDPGMLDVARHRPIPEQGSVEWIELSAAEIEDRFPEASFDAVVSCLAFSELTAEEQDYTLGIALSRLVPGGEILLADETLPESGLRRALYRVARAPLVVLTYAFTQTTTRPVLGLADRVRAAGFAGVEETRLWSDTFLLVHGHKEAGA